jgi:hypothetical protein
MNKKFEYDEIVIVTSSDSKFKEILNKKGYVAGDAYDDKTGKWFYGIYIFDEGIVYYCNEDDLESTGAFYKED